MLNSLIGIIKHSENSFLPSDIQSVNKLNYFMLQESKIIPVVKMVYKAPTFHLAPGHQIRYTYDFLKLLIVKNIKTRR